MNYVLLTFETIHEITGEKARYPTDHTTKQTPTDESVAPNWKPNNMEMNTEFSPFYSRYR